MRNRTLAFLSLALAAASLATRAAAQSGAPAPATSADTLEFTPVPTDSSVLRPEQPLRLSFLDEDVWLHARASDELLTDADEWRSTHRRFEDLDLRTDYNRVDRLRVGVGYQVQQPRTMNPRLGARIEYAFGRDRVLYGAQLEQPLLPPGRLAVGVRMMRITDHNQLQQVEDLENSAALLFARTDYRDYFEREGVDAYLAWRVPDFSTVSLGYASDQFLSLSTDSSTRSFFYRDRPLRPNPAVDEGQMHSARLRLERLAHRTRRTRAGLYHWIEFERAGGGLGGDFRYTRALGDFRSVVRLSPATTLALRAVGGATLDGELPRQKQFTVGGVDGLRAHAFSAFRGDQIALAQAEYTLGLWQLHSTAFEGGLNAIAFVDAGRAWLNPAHQWDPVRQRFPVDGGFGIGTSEDNLRVYFARDLQRPSSGFLISLRLQRPF